MKRTPGAGIAMGGVLVLAMAAAESRAQDVNEVHLLGHALRYAAMIERAFGRLHGHIRYRSSAVTSWSGAAIPPGETRWESNWTDAGLRARYCDAEVSVTRSGPRFSRGREGISPPAVGWGISNRRFAT